MDNKFKYLLTYSLKKRMAKKSFLIVNIIIFILLIIFCNIGNIITFAGGDFSESTTVYLYDNTSKQASDYYIAMFDDESGYNFEKKENFDIANKEALLEEAPIILVFEFNDKGYLYADCYVEDISLTDETIINSSVSNLKSYYWLLDHEDIQTEIDDFNNSIVLNINRQDDSSSSVVESINYIISMIIVLPTFMLLIFMVQFLGVDIIEEKSSRSIEIIISNVPAVTHFSSKLLASIIYLLVQGLLLCVYSAIGILIATILGSSSTGASGDLFTSLGVDSQIVSEVVAKLPVTILSTGIFILVGYTFFLILVAIISSMANTMEDYQSFQAPIMLTLLAGFYIALFGSSFEGSIFMKVMGFIPLFSTFLAPVLFLNGTFGIIEIIISFILLLAATVLVIKFGAPLYKESILDYSDGKLLAKLKRSIKRSKNK